MKNTKEWANCFVVMKSQCFQYLNWIEMIKKIISVGTLITPSILHQFRSPHCLMLNVVYSNLKMFEIQQIKKIFSTFVTFRGMRQRDYEQVTAGSRDSEYWFWNGISNVLLLQIKGSSKYWKQMKSQHLFNLTFAWSKWHLISSFQLLAEYITASKNGRIKIQPDSLSCWLFYCSTKSRTDRSYRTEIRFQRERASHWWKTVKWIIDQNNASKTIC